MNEEFKTWEQLSEKEQTEIMYCELHKDVYGVKARWYKADTLEQAVADLAGLQAQAELVWAREKVHEQECIVKFEVRVQATIALGAKTREEALRWIHDAEGSQGDNEHLAYTLGLPYTYFRLEA